MSALGMAQLGGVSQGTLAAGQEVKLPLTLPASCVAIVAMGGGSVADFSPQAWSTRMATCGRRRSRTTPRGWCARASSTRGFTRWCCAWPMERETTWSRVSWAATEANPTAVPRWLRAGLASLRRCSFRGTVTLATRVRGATSSEGTCGRQAKVSSGCTGSTSLSGSGSPSRSPRISTRCSTSARATCDDDGNEVACNDDSGPKLLTGRDRPRTGDVLRVRRW